MGIFHFGRNPSACLPGYLQRTDIFDGSYKSLSGSCVASTLHKGRKSGMCSNGALLALCRAKMIVNGSNADGYGCNGNVAVASVTLSTSFEGKDVGMGREMQIAFRYSQPYAPNSNRILIIVNSLSADAGDLKSTWPLFLALMPLFCAEQEFSEAFTNFCDDKIDESKRICAAIICCDMMYYLTSSSGASILVDDSEYQAPKKLITTIAGSAAYAPDNYVGTLRMFSTNGRINSSSIRSKKALAAIDPVSFNGKYALIDKATLTPEEKALVPVLDNRYIITQEVEEVCKMVKWAIENNAPVNFNNILLRSEPGYGKSTIYVIMAAAFGLPLHTLALNAMSEPLDLIGSFVPLSGDVKTARQILSDENIPDAEDICIDPVTSYKQITGKDNPDASEGDCLSALMIMASKKATAEKDGNKNQTRVEFVPGIIPAMARPCMIGLDEISMPMNAGVVPTLHPMMDDTQKFTLPTGEVVTRNPLTIMVSTTNVGLEGNRAINQAYQDRNALIVDLDAPSDAELKARIIANTGFDAAKYPNINIDMFIRAYNELQTIAKSRRLTDGVIGPRKLSSWVMATMFMGSPRKAAESTIISGGTTDPDGKADLRQKVMELFAN